LPDSSSDSKLFADRLARAKGGSDDERAALLEIFRQYLRNIASDAIGPQPKAQLSESDLVQSAIIDAYKNFHMCRASNRAEFKAWLRQTLSQRDAAG